MAKDYYKILGIENNASADEVKAAFRKLAHEHHPDKKGGNEAKFKEINEAYQVLGNADKRKQYDQFGADFTQQGGFGGGMGWDDFMSQARGGGGGFSGGIDLGDIFGDMFGFSAQGGPASGWGGNRKARGSDIQVEIQIEFKEAVFGIKKDMELYKASKCDHCHGNQAEPGTKINTCKTCGGQGRVSRVQRTFIGNIQTTAICPDCGGEGKIPEKKCTVCHGHGVVNKKEKIEINVPAGIENNSTIRFTGKGEAVEGGGTTGDLYVNVRVKPDKHFVRQGNNILVQKTISFVMAALGGTIDVETLDGEVSLSIPDGTQPGTNFRLKGKGVSYMNSSGRGDMFVEVAVEIPKHLSRKQKKLLEEFDEE